VKVLALDTSGNVSTVAVLVDGALAAEITLRSAARHGETLLGHLERALGEAGVQPAAVGLVAVGLGPGSFTGLRVGVAAAKGLAFAQKLPIVGVPTSRALGRGLFGAVRVPLVDAHKGEVFAAVYEAGPDGRLRTHLWPVHGPPEAMAQAVRQVAPGEIVIAGSALAVHRDRLLAALGPAVVIAPPVFDVPRAALVALEAEEAFLERGPDDLASLEPLYLRASDAVPAP